MPLLLNCEHVSAQNAAAPTVELLGESGGELGAASRSALPAERVRRPGVIWSAPATRVYRDTSA
eukprot:4101837-Prymnesium_polylepis.1